MVADEHAYLFNLTTSQTFKPRRSHSALHHDRKRGPSFGHEDLVTFREDFSVGAKGGGWDYTYGNTDKINNLTQTTYGGD